MTNNSFHPGVFLQELIQWQRITALELAEQTGIPETRIIEITQQRGELDQHTSEELAAYFGNSARFWLNLQKSFNKRKVQSQAATVQN
jgi:addiction module HigA family antidote